MLNQIIFDADFVTKHPGISTRPLWTIGELINEYESELDIPAEQMANDEPAW